MPRRWEFYRSAMGADVVHKELDKCKLKRDERTRLGTIMTRAVERRLQPKDFKPLGDGLRELRIEGEGRTFRLFYAEEEGGLLLLALKFVNKKSTQGIATRPEDIETARKRLVEWRARDERDKAQG